MTSFGFLKYEYNSHAGKEIKKQHVPVWILLIFVFSPAKRTNIFLCSM